jgi:hypothetical protein
MTGIVFLLLKYGFVPQPVAIMTASKFDRPEQIGAVAFKRFYDPLSRAPFAVFGAPPRPEFHARIAEGFLLAAAAAGKKYDLVLAEPALEPLRETSGAQVESYELNREDMSELAARLRALASQGKRVLIYSASTFSSHALKGNAIARLEGALGEPLFALSSGTLVLRATHEFLVDPPCIGIARDQNGTAGLGCLMLSASRRLYRKQLPLDRYVAVMEQEAPADFLLMTSSPQMALRGERGPGSSPKPPPASVIPPERAPESRTGSPLE